MSFRNAAYTYIIQKYGTVFYAVGADPNYKDLTSSSSVTDIVQQAINAITTGVIYIKSNAGTPGTLTHKGGVTVLLETSGRIQVLNGVVDATFTSASPYPFTSQGNSYLIYKDGTTYYGRNGKTGVNDYSGSDAATVIQNTINGLASRGRIFFKAGDYTINSQITINQQQAISLIGEGSGYNIDYTKVPSATRWIAGSDIQMLNIAGVGAVGDRLSGIHLRDMLFEGVVGSTKDGIYVDRTDLFLFEKSVVRRFDRGLVLSNCDAATIIESSPQNCGEGFTLLAGTSWPNIQSNIFADNTRYGLSGTSPVSGRICGNLFFHGGTTGGYAGAYMQVADKMLWQGNNFQQNTGRGLDLSSSTRNVVTGNLFGIINTPTNPPAGLLVLNGTLNTIVGNHFVDDQGTPTTPYAIYEAASANNNLIANNKLEGTFTISPMVIVGPLTRAFNNPGYNPLGLIASPYDNTNNRIGTLGVSGTLTSAKVYTCVVTPLDLYLAAGTVSAMTKNGQAIPYNSTLTHLHLEPSDTWSLTFTVTPTTNLVFGL